METIGFIFTFNEIIIQFEGDYKKVIKKKFFTDLFSESFMKTNKECIGRAVNQEERKFHLGFKNKKLQEVLNYCCDNSWSVEFKKINEKLYGVIKIGFTSNKEKPSAPEEQIEGKITYF